MVQTPAATFHLEKWYAIAECFLFNDYLTFDVFFTTDSLSHRMTVANHHARATNTVHAHADWLLSSYVTMNH